VLPHVAVTTHEVPGPNQKVEEVERALGLLATLVLVQALEQFRVQRGCEVGIGLNTKVLQGTDECISRLEHTHPRHAWRKLSAGTFARPEPVAIARELNQPAFQPIVVVRQPV